MCQPLATAALIAVVECMVAKDLPLGLGEVEDDGKNRLVQPCPHPEKVEDYIASMAVTDRNMDAWSKHKKLMNLVLRSRVFFPSHWTWRSGSDGGSAGPARRPLGRRLLVRRLASAI